MTALVRYLPLLILMIGMDYLFVKTIIEPLFDSTGVLLFQSLYWLIPFSLIALLVFVPKKAAFAVDQPFRRDSIAMYQGYYIAKVFSFLIGLVLLTLVGATFGLFK